MSTLVGVAGSNLTFFFAIPHVGARFAVLALTLPPLLKYLGELALRTERFGTIRATRVAPTLAGAGVLAVGKLSVPDGNVFWMLRTGGTGPAGDREPLPGAAFA